MKVDKIVGLLFPKTERTEAKKPVVEAQVEQEDAVKIAKNFGSQASDIAAREAKVSRLEEQIRAGNYQIDTRQVAAKLYSDLL